jgi:hypothetical protein
MDDIADIKNREGRQIKKLLEGIFLPTEVKEAIM